MAEPLTSLRIEDYSDREVLLIVEDLGEDDGWVDSLAVAERIGIQTNRPRASVASRLSWLKRYGAVEREFLRDEHGEIRYHRDGRVRYSQRWRLTDRGRVLASGRLTQGQQNSLEKLATEERLLLITRWVATRQRSTDDTGGQLMKREWRYGVSPLRSLNGSGPGYD